MNELIEQDLACKDTIWKVPNMNKVPKKKKKWCIEKNEVCRFAYIIAKWNRPSVINCNNSHNEIWKIPKL